MGFRNEVYVFEWLCITTLTFSFPLEYFTSVVTVLVTFPVVRQAQSMQFNFANIVNIDLSLAYLVLLFASLPYFLSTLVYVCRKRTHQIEYKQELARKRRSARSRDNFSSEESN